MTGHQFVCLSLPFPFLTFGVTSLRHVDGLGLSKLWEEECHVSSLNGRISGLSDLHKLSVHQWQCSFVSIMSAFLAVTISRALKHICSRNQNWTAVVGSQPFLKFFKKHWVKIKYFQIYIFRHYYFSLSFKNKCPEIWMEIWRLCPLFIPNSPA